MRWAHKLAIIFSVVIASTFFVWGSLPFRIVFKSVPSVLAINNPPVMLKDINPGSGDSFPRYFFEYNGLIYFFANDGINGRELWRTDGTAAGTHMFMDINPGSGSSNAGSFTILNGLLYFVADDGTHGYEIWSSDGTVAGTAMVEDVFADPGRAYGPTAFNGKLYFPGEDATYGKEVWVSDGTPGTASLLKDIRVGIFDSFPGYFIVYNGKLYFDATDAYDNAELWVTDGTELGTTLVKDINPGGTGTGSNPFSFDALAVYDGFLYFAANTVDEGRELWRTDGTELGTTLVKDIQPGPDAGYPKYFAVYNDKLYFGANDGINGSELWQSDGTADGTFMVKDINPGAGNSNPEFLSAIYKNLLYFEANDGITGVELWQTDGSDGGTVLTYDINPGISNGVPQFMIAYKDLLFFYATDGLANGYELWSYNSSRGFGTQAYGRIDLIAVVNGGTLSVDDVKLYMSGELTAPGSYTRRNGTYVISADAVVDYNTSFTGDCTPSGSITLSGNELTCTVVFNFIEPTPIPTPSESPSVSPTASVSASPELTPTPSEVPTLAPTPIRRPFNTPTPTPEVPVTGGGGGGGTGGSLTGGVLTPSPSSSLSPSPSPSPTDTAPTTIIEDVRQVIETVNQTTQVVVDVTTQVTAQVAVQAAPVAAPVLTAVISTPVAFTGLAAATASGSPTGFAFAQLGYFFEIVGLKRRRKVWGVIYNSRTKQPIPFAKIELRDQNNRTLETRYADKDGRYGFLTSLASISKDSMQISLAPSSLKYTFPSQVVTSSSDFLVYDHVYRGGPLNIYDADLVGYDIPLDPQPGAVSHAKSHPRINGLVVRVMDASFWVGLVAAPLNAYLFPSLLSVGVLFAFIFTNIFRISSDLYRPFGMVYDSQTRKPMPYALVTLNKPDGTRLAFSISDEQGRYFILAEPGSYTLRISTPAQVQPPRTQSHLLTSTKGWVRENVRV